MFLDLKLYCILMRTRSRVNSLRVLIMVVARRRRFVLPTVLVCFIFTADRSVVYGLTL